MAGTLAAVGVVAGTAVLTVGLAAVGSAAVLGQRVAGAADAAALAAADAASGAVPGMPCEVADAVAAASEAQVVACAIDGATVMVTVTAPFGQLLATASARAGPPP